MTLHIRALRLTRDTILETFDALQAQGEHGYEAIALWLGAVSEDGRALVQRVHVPRQRAFRSREGVSVRVDAEEMEAVADLQRRTGVVLLAQLHSHPTIAYHSELDDAKPIVTEDGALSIVVPHFGFTSSSDLSSCAVYQLRDGTFVRLDPGAVARLFVIDR